MALDTEFQGIGDGAVLTHDLANPDGPFMFYVPEGNLLDLRIGVKADGENEMIAMDSIEIIGDPMPTNRVFRESFESDGQGTRYTASSPFNDKKADYWNRGTNADFFGLRDEYLNPSGTHFWAARDTNAPEGNGNTVQTLEFNNIDVSSFENLQFSGLFAAGSTRFSGFPRDDRILVQYQVDGGPLQDGLRFSPTGKSRPLALDTDFNGVGDGARLTRNLANSANPFTFAIPDGNTLNLRIEVKADGWRERVAFDDIQVTGNPIPTDQVFKESFETDGQGSRYTASQPFNDQATDIWDRGTHTALTGVAKDYVNANGSYYWAARDTNAPEGNGNTVQTLEINNIDISSREELRVSGLFGAGASAFGGFPRDDRILVQYRVDGGTYQNGLRFSPRGIGGPLALDTNFDGIGDGAELTADFNAAGSPFTFMIPDGSTLDLRIEVKTDGDAEEIAFDAIRVTGNPTGMVTAQELAIDRALVELLGP